MQDEFEGIIGYFHSAKALESAVLAAQQAQLEEYEAYLPVGDFDILEELQPSFLPVRGLALAGAIAGIAFGLWMTIATSLDYPLVTGGKPLIALPPYLVITFELMLLFAALGAVIGFLWSARLLHLTPHSAYRRDFAVDTFALFVRCAASDEASARAEQVLRQTGASEIHNVFREERGILGDVP